MRPLEEIIREALEILESESDITDMDYLWNDISDGILGGMILAKYFSQRGYYTQAYEQITLCVTALLYFKVNNEVEYPARLMELLETWEV